jgi:hypothetical protein
MKTSRLVQKRLRNKILIAMAVVAAPLFLFSASVDSFNRYRCARLCEKSGYPYCVYRADKHKFVDFNGRCQCVTKEDRERRGVLAEGIEMAL